MTTVKALRPLFYLGKKYAKGDTFDLQPRDGVKWGDGAIEVVGEEAPAGVFAGRQRKPKKSPTTLSEMAKAEDSAHADLATKKGVAPGEMPR